MSDPRSLPAPSPESALETEAVRTSYRAHANPFVAQGLEQLGAEVIARAHSATLVTASGRELVDFASGGFGHGHPLVIERTAAQLKAMPLSMRQFFSRPLGEWVERVAGIMPSGLEISYPCNSGAEAVEGALKLAKGYHRDRTRFVAAVGAYHGSTLGALGVCGIPALRGRLQRLPVEATFVPYGDARALREAVDERTAAVILEPVATGAGVRVPPPGYLAAARVRCDQAGALLIADEVTTGLGRTGKPFGVQHDRIVPDVMVIGGALGGGALPMGAYVAQRAVNERVYGGKNPALHGSTTGGNPASCVASIAAIEVFEREGLAARAAEAGRRLEVALAALSRRHPGDVVEVQVRGLLAGLRLRDPVSAREVQRLALARGALVRLDGLAMGEAWIGLRPPMLVSEAELERGLASLDEALDEALDKALGARGARAEGA